MKMISTLKMFFLVSVSLLYIHGVPAQQRKQMDHADFKIWNRITGTEISNDGNWVAWLEEPGEGDPTLLLYDVEKRETKAFERGKDPGFTADNKFLVFRIGPSQDTIKSLKRQKVDEDKHPGDSLAVYALNTGQLTMHPGIHTFTIPSEWSGHLCYQLKALESPNDTSGTGKKTGKGSREKGYPLVALELSSGLADTIPFVKSYQLAKKADQMIFYSTGTDSTFHPGIYRYQFGQMELKPLSLQKGKYTGLAVSEDGEQMAFLGDMDTTDAMVRPHMLFYETLQMDSARVIGSQGAEWMEDGWLIPSNASPEFSENGRFLHFGTAPPPILEDTTLLEEEIVEVEVWHSDDPVLYTQQNVRVKDEKKRTYLAIYDTKSEAFMQVADETRKESTVDREKNSPYIVTYDLTPYFKYSSWTGMRLRDLYVTDVRQGETRLIASGIEGSARLSPDFQYVFWYNAPDTSWFAYQIEADRIVDMTPELQGVIYDELNDRPMHPNQYGIAGWLEDDAGVLVYDRYDIWLVDPNGREKPQNLTNGREDRITYRYARLDPQEKSIQPGQNLLLHTFYHADKSSGYAKLDLGSGKLRHLIKGQFRYDPGPQKAENGNTIVYTKESFREFPDLRLTTDMFRSSAKISDANPQQRNYAWGNIEIYEWEFDGQRRRGLLVKPDGFDPSKKYPMIVNFYERSTDGLHNYRHPQPHRSTINYPFYVSRGYVIFNPDVEYRVGYPGESAYDAVVPGTQALIAEGFIDPDRIALQGHSWGGYQVAHILTQTDMFACAESGAPVVNMISAYGGIRWGSGMSRMFQYEHTQSRIGATLWERPDLYILNSPIFNADKIDTPVLILHNDKDGAVPWYQGIEFFVAMRRLGKPAWMLNYNDEPHWPLKLQNRKDFNIRMQQFFDHYLMDAPMPRWMKRGVPSVEKGILQGYELTGELDRQ